MQIEIIHTSSAKKAGSIMALDGHEPIECSFGTDGSVLGPLNMDHHGAESNREGVAIRAHGMGYDGTDAGCPEQKDWRKSLAKVHKTFGAFQVVASGSDREVFALQKKFLAEDRLKFDLMDLATGKLTHEERCRLVTNALLLFVARNRGFQTVSTFLMILLEKWLAEPQYGSETLPRARRQITDFCQYLEVSEDKKAELLRQIFAGVESK